MKTKKRKPQDLSQTFRTNLARKRAEAGLSYRGLAAKAGLTGAYLFQVETGSRTPTMASISKIALALDTTPVQMLMED